MFKIFGSCRGSGGDWLPETCRFGGSEPLEVLAAEIDRILHYPLGVFIIDFPVLEFDVRNLNFFEITTLKSSGFAGDFAKIFLTVASSFGRAVKPPRGAVWSGSGSGRRLFAVGGLGIFVGDPNLLVERGAKLLGTGRKD